MPRDVNSVYAKLTHARMNPSQSRVHENTSRVNLAILLLNGRVVLTLTLNMRWSHSRVGVTYAFRVEYVSWRERVDLTEGDGVAQLVEHRLEIQRPEV